MQKQTHQSQHSAQIQCLRCQFIQTKAQASTCPNCGSAQHMVELPNSEVTHA